MTREDLNANCKNCGAGVFKDNGSCAYCGTSYPKFKMAPEINEAFLKFLLSDLSVPIYNPIPCYIKYECD